MTNPKAVPRSSSFDKKDGVDLQYHLEEKCSAQGALLHSEVESLTQSVAERFAARDRALSVELALRDKALDLAQSGLMAKLESMNEIRAQLNTQAGTFVTKEKLDACVADVMGEVKIGQNDIRRVQEELAVMRGKASMGSVYISYGLAVLSLIGTALAVLKAFGG
jgi:hypothetical protein